MHPFLIEIGWFRLPTYGIIAVAAFIACALVVRKYARKEGLDPGLMVDAVLFSAIAGLVGARLLEAIVSWERILADPSHVWTLLNSAGVYLGGALGGLGFGLWWFRRKKIPLLTGLDILALVGALSMAIARWGCFFSGCCWGKPTDLPWAVTFPEIGRRLHAGRVGVPGLPDLPGLPDVPIHPTQIYLSLNSLAIFLLLIFLYRRKRFHGQIGMIYLALYAVTRFFIEYVRGDAVRGTVFGGLMSTSQFISILMLAGSVAIYLWLARRPAPPVEPPSSRTEP